MSIRRLAATGLLVLAIASLTSTVPSGAAAPGPLFAPAERPVRAKDGFRSEPAFIRGRYVKVDVDLLRSVAGKATPTAKPSLELALFDDQRVTATADEVVASVDGFSWRGSVASGSTTDGFITMTLAKGSVVAVIGTKDHRYAIEPVGSGVHALVELDPANLPAADDAVVTLAERESTASAPVGSIAPAPADSAGSVTAGAAAGSGPVIKVLVVFTQEAAGQTDMQARAAAAIDQANAAYANSGVAQRVQLAGGTARQLLSYSETNDSNLDLTRLQGTSAVDPYMNEVHGWRDELRADVVALYVSNYSAVCGLGYLMNPVSASFESFAFNTQSATTGCHSIFVLPHELGHNMAAHHDRANASSTPVYPFAYGWVSTGGDFRTVMAYDNPACPGGSCAPVPYFSNPDVYYNGQPTGRPEGQADAADNRKTLNNTVSTVMAFRSPPDDNSPARARGDFNGDGKEDVAAFYDFGNAATGLYVWYSNGLGFNAPVLTWNSGAGNWDWNRTKAVAGDFNGDGKADVGAFYNYDNANTSLSVWNGPTLSSGAQKWISGAGNWDWNRMKSIAGDFNGDGKADVGAFYNYDNSNTSLFVWNGSALNGASQTWNSGPGGWDWNRTKGVAGDFNGDGKADVGAFYNYGNANTSLSVWNGPTLSSGNQKWISGAGNWDWNRMKSIAGDFNGDGKADVGAFYNYDNSNTSLFVWNGSALNGASQTWNSGPGGWDWNRTKAVAGDFNGDGKADVGAFYNYGNANTSLSVWNGPTLSSGNQKWISGAGNWRWDSMKQL